MKNSLGNPARGEAFFKREKEIQKIYNVLKTGSSIYLSAPRRVGKTSILKYLEEFPESGYYFIYIITESTDTLNEFFKNIFEELLKSNAIKTMAIISTKVKDFITVVLGRVKSIQDIELREGEESEYYSLLVELFSHISTEHGRVVVMIDEFPQTIQNILDKDGKGPAQLFIQKNRELRHHKNLQDKINFIYTGSVSLYPMVEKVTSLTSINDLRSVDVNPLDESEAIEFLSLLMSDEKIQLDQIHLKYTVYKIGWLIPFHIQLIQQEIIDVYESGNHIINETLIDKAFDQVVHSRNKPQFEPYFSRLSKLFKGNEYLFVIEVLKLVAKSSLIDRNDLINQSVKYDITDLKYIMSTLESDGYLVQTEGNYKYNSPILQMWCSKHICD